MSKKDRRSARTKKREVHSSSLVAGIDSCELGCDKAVRVSWTPPTSSRRVNEFFDFTNPDTGCLSRINSAPPGFLIAGCRPEGIPVILRVGRGVQFGWLSTWPSMPSWPRSYSSCAAMSPESCQ